MAAFPKDFTWISVIEKIKHLSCLWSTEYKDPTEKKIVIRDLSLSKPETRYNSLLLQTLPEKTIKINYLCLDGTTRILAVENSKRTKGSLFSLQVIAKEP